MTVKLDIYDDLGGQRQIGFARPDFAPSKVVHTIVRAPAGAAFTVDEHFKTCEVCRKYGVTQEMFHAFMMRRGSKLVRIVAGEWFDIFNAFGFIAEREDGRFVTCSATEDAHGRWSLSSFDDDGSMLIDRKTTAEVHEMLAELPSVTEWEE